MARPPRAPGRLSARELEVIAMAAEGDTNGEIAGRLHIAKSSVEGRLRRATAAVGARNRTHLVTLALRSGQLPLLVPVDADSDHAGGAA